MGIQTRLEGLANFNLKSEGWIKADLSISKSFFVGRIFWMLVAKRFNFLRDYFYGVNLAQSQASLLKVRADVKNNPDPRLIILFNQAVQKFNILMPKYRVEEIISDRSFELTSSSALVDNFFPVFQEFIKTLDKNCSLLEKRYAAYLDIQGLSDRVKSRALQCFSSFSAEDLLLMATITKDYEFINAIQKKFKKSFVFAEANLAVYDCRVQNLSKIFQRHVVQEKNNDEKDQPVLKSMLDQQTASFADIMGSYVYTHLPLSGEVSRYYSPWGSRSDILKRLVRSDFLGSKETLPSYVTPEAPTYKGYGINFHYSVFGMRCTLVSLMKLDVQYEQAMKRFGIEEKGIFHLLASEVMKRFQDPSKIEETQKNQKRTLEKFLRVEAIGLLYADNYAACHIPTEQELVTDYQLPLSQIAKNDFIVFYHRPFDKNLTDAFTAAPFDRYKKSKNFLLRMDNNDLEDVQKKHKDASLFFSNVLHKRAEVEARRVMTEYHLLEESLIKEKALRDQEAFKDWEGALSFVSVEEVVED